MTALDPASAKTTFGEPRPGISYRIRPAAYGIIFDPHGRLALVRDAPYLFLPGGGIDPGETPEETLRREIWEECGRASEVGPWIGSAVQFHATDGEPIELHANFFAARFVGEPTRTGDLELSWWHLDEASAQMCHACQIWAARLACAAHARGDAGPITR